MSHAIQTRCVFRTELKTYGGAFLLKAVNFFRRISSIVKVLLNSLYASATLVDL